MSNQTVKVKFSDLSNKMNINLKNGLKLYISLIKNNIDCGKNHKKTR